jgi:hypothetical protein
MAIATAVVSIAAPPTTLVNEIDVASVIAIDVGVDGSVDVCEG